MKQFFPSILFILTLTGCGSPESAEQSASDSLPESDRITMNKATLEKAGVLTGTITRKVMGASLTVNGVVDVPPQNLVSVSFPPGGYLYSTRLMPGMRIKKGEVIAEMEDPSLVQLQQDYLMARARLTFLEREFARQQTLNADKVSADKVFEQVRSDYEGQQAMVSANAEKLRMIGIVPESLSPERISRRVSLRSPINGFVSKVHVNIGKYVQPADVLFELINPDDIHAALSIFEKDLARVSIGQKVSISFVDEPDRVYDGEVILVNRNVDEDRIAVAHCHFRSKPAQLLPGMFLNARIHVRETEVPALPESAVVRYEQREFVFVESSAGVFDMKVVRTGEKEDGFVEIIGGAEALEGRTLVIRNAYSLLGALKNKAEEE
ncbi:MAG: efflux RND transporter periplasmic adaptor subunit [Chitinophagaceae bacterium]